MKTSSCKAKGRRLAEEVKQLLLRFWPEGKSSDIEVARTSLPGSDLRLSPTAQSVFPFEIECKNQEKIQIWQALAQNESRVNAEDLAQNRKLPVLFFRRNRSEIYVTLRAEHFLKLMNPQAKTAPQPTAGHAPASASELAPKSASESEGSARPYRPQPESELPIQD